MLDWREHAACSGQGIPTDMFFADGREAAMLLKICAQCPVRRHCLSEAFRMEQNNPTARYGIWGGMTPSRREKEWRKVVALREVPLCRRNKHVMDETNTYRNANGSKECRACKRKSSQEFDERRRAG